MKTAFETCQWRKNYLDALPTPKILTVEEMDRSHPYREIIHRKSQILNGDMTINLGLARLKPTEFYQSDDSDQNTWGINMDGFQIGLSSSSDCDSHGFVANSYVYPYDLLKLYLGDLITRSNDSVAIGIRKCTTYKCFSRKIPASERTVREAFNCHGKHNDFILDGKFSCYWDSNQHCTLCLRESTTFLYTDTTNKFESDGSFIFDNAHFHRNEWTVCANYLGVKVPDIYFLLAEKKIPLDDALTKMEKFQRSLVTALLQAFANPLAETLEHNSELNTQIVKVFNLSSFDNLSGEDSTIIIRIIDLYEFQLYGWETSEWSELLRPALLYIASRDTRKHSLIHESAKRIS